MNIDEVREERAETSDEDEDAKPHPHQRDEINEVKTDKDEIDSRKLDVMIGNYEWLTDFFRTKLNCT